MVYRRLQLIDGISYGHAIEKELIDRYGPVPEPVRKLLALLEVRILCRELHISKAKIKGGDAIMTIEPSTPIRPSAMAAMMEGRIRMLSEYSLSIRVSHKSWRDDLETIQNILKEFLKSDAQV